MARTSGKRRTGRAKRSKRSKAKRANPHAVALGKLGGKATSKAKAAAVRVNGRLGGRPRKDGQPPQRKAAASYAGHAPGHEVDADRASSSREQQGLTRDTRQVEDADRASSSEPHIVGTEPPTPENDPIGRFRDRRLIGWTLGDGSGAEGYSVETYFDAEGKYLGPDEHGIEPIFE